MVLTVLLFIYSEISSRKLGSPSEKLYNLHVVSVNSTNVTVKTVSVRKYAQPSQIQACLAIANFSHFFDAAVEVFFLSGQIASGFSNVNQSAFTWNAIDTWFLVRVCLVFVENRF